MEYIGKLYGKVGSSYIQLEETTEDIENLKKRLSISEQELIKIKNKLTQITLSADRMASEKNEIYKTVEEIRKILGN